MSKAKILHKPQETIQSRNLPSKTALGRTNDNPNYTFKSLSSIQRAQIIHEIYATPLDIPAKPSSMSFKAYELFKGATYAEKRSSLPKKALKSDAFDDKFHNKIIREAVDSNQIIDQIRLKERKKSK